LAILMNIPRPNMEKIFRSIYLNRGWFNGSGSGSLPENTEEYRIFLQDFMRTHDIKTVLDLGCGDWQSTKLIDWKQLEYTGIDVVHQVINDVRKTHEADNVHFVCDDVTECELPPADLVIIKDVLQHWPNEIVQKFLTRLKAYKYVLITNTVEIQDSSKQKSAQTVRPVNTDIQLGEGRPLDLTKPPFNVPCKELLRYRSTKRYHPIQDIKSVVLF